MCQQHQQQCQGCQREEVRLQYEQGPEEMDPNFTKILVWMNSIHVDMKEYEEEQCGSITIDFCYEVTKKYCVDEPQEKYVDMPREHLVGMNSIHKDMDEYEEEQCDSITIDFCYEVPKKYCVEEPQEKYVDVSREHNRQEYGWNSENIRNRGNLD